MSRKWWNERTLMEKCLFVGLIVTILIIISLIVTCIVLVTKKNTDAPKEKKKSQLIEFSNKLKEADVDLRAGSIHSTSELFKRMDLTVDPCDDFYQFTCGNFLKTTNIPERQSSVSAFSVTENIMTEKLQTIMEEPIKSKEFRPFVLTKKLYKACMNQTLTPEDLISIIKELGGWPVLEGAKWNASAFDWKKSVYDFNRIGFSISYFIDFSVATDLKNSKRRVIIIDEPDLSILRISLEDKTISNYFDMMANAARFFGATTEEAMELEEAMDFYIKLARITVPTEMRKNETFLYNPMTIDEMQEKYPSIPWLEYINNILAPHSKLNHDDRVIVKVPQFLEKFQDLIKDTPRRALANYVIWRPLSESLSFLVTNIQKKIPPSQFCVTAVTTELPTAVGALYVRKYFNEATRKNALEMVKNLQDEFENILKQVDWMDNETKKNALDKLKAMCATVGYPEELKDDKKLDELYCDLEVNENEYFRSILNVTKFKRSINFKRLKKPVNRPDWLDHENIADVNAFYTFSENCIQIPAGILQGVFFDPERPQYMNYGSYTVPEINMTVNGNTILGEIIADYGGLKVAYMAYNKWAERNGEEEARLPGLNYTGRQLFWIAAAGIRCSKDTSDQLFDSVMTDEHASSKFRIVGSFSNINDFANDFKCP